MKKLNKETQQAKRFWNEFLYSNDYKLWDVYSSYSREKERAFNECREFLKECGARNIDIKIISHNSMTFTIAGLTLDGRLIVITKLNTYVIDVSDKLIYNGYYLKRA